MPTQSDHPPEYLCRLADLIEEHIDLSALLQVPSHVTMTVPVSCVCAEPVHSLLSCNTRLYTCEDYELKDVMSRCSPKSLPQRPG